MSDSDVSYSLEHRVRICIVCGTGLSVPLQGGGVICPNCSTTMTVPPRNLEPLGSRSGPGGEAEAPEQLQQRLASLRTQEQHYNASNPYSTTDAPEGYEQLAYLRDSDPQSLAKVLTLYREAYQRCEQQCTPQNERLVYWLTWKLNNILIHQGQPLAGWSVIQTSLDVLENPGYQHLLRCEAASKARKAGDYQSAEAWLALCDPAPTILELDSEYRTTLGVLHLARGEWDRALAQVGVGPTAVPHEPASWLVVGCIRVAALEQLGRTAEAEAVMRELHNEAKAAAAETLKVCLAPDSVFAPARPAWARVKQAAGTIIGKPDEMVPAGFKLLIIAGILALVALGPLYGSVHYARKIAFLETWKTAPGHIETVRTSEVGSGKKARVRIAVVYAFEAKGKTYRGTTWNTEAEYGEFSNANRATREVAKLRAHRDRTIHYNPKKPSQSALDIEWTGAYAATIAFGVFAFGLLLALFFVLRAHLHRRRAHEAWKAREGVGRAG